MENHYGIGGRKKLAHRAEVTIANKESNDFLSFIKEQNIKNQDKRNINDLFASHAKLKKHQF